jgi:hypothetical protein
MAGAMKVSRRGTGEMQMQKRSLAVVLALALIIAVTGCAESEPQTADATVETQVPRTGEVTYEVTPPVEEPPGQPVAPSPSLAIESFTADAVELSDGRRRVTFAWKTRGAGMVSIWLYTHHRFHPSWQELPPDGTHVFEGDTLYPNPDATLIAYGSEDNRVQENLTIDWPCLYRYFFTPDTEVYCSTPSPRLCSCPRHAATITQAVEQPFENGRMIWFQGTDDQPFYPDTILVMFDDPVDEGSPDVHEAVFFEDTWTPGELDGDLDLAPPSGLFRPVRGFGKLWRSNTDVRERIGWATAPEQAFEGVWQRLGSEYLGADAFFRTADGRLVFFTGWWMAGGSWTFVTP